MAFILAIFAGQQDYARVGDIGTALIMAILCGVMSWASAQRTVSGIAASVDSATERLLGAAHGDLQAPIPKEVKRELPDLGVAMESLFSQVRTNLDNVHLLAMFDQVTGLPNRTSFCRQVERMLVEREDDGPAALFFIDLDGFKAVNDNLGHETGDRVLIDVAAVLRNSGVDVAARLGGDEFCLLLHGNEFRARQAAERIVQSVAAMVTGGPTSPRIGASIGVARTSGSNIEAALRSADAACYRAKRSGKSQFVLAVERL